MQKFMIVGDKAFREDAALEAVKAGANAESPIVEFDTSARINEFYAVTDYMFDSQGQPAATVTRFVRTLEEIAEIALEGSVIRAKKIFVFPFLEKKERSDKGIPRVRKQIPAQA